MALTQGARKKIQSFVQSAKVLLIREFASQLQQYYGIRPDGSYVMVEELTTHDAAIMQTARLLRERLNYLEGTIAGENKAEEAVEQLVREQAFTILNRFAALRMAEERKIIQEAIRNGYQSEGFQVFDQLTGGARTAEVFERYTWFLKANFDELAIDLPAVFDRFSPYALLFPSERVLLELLKIIDDEDLSIYREEGQQPMNLWSEDETIGWVYQYYNSRDEISAMREASSAPRNSRELAVRNQFFTPRYVVQFLVDNSLGRQWFEMTKGQTDLVDSCQYMVKRENEIFLAKGETVPETKIEGANYIEYRALKDPRAILMLDPACGSMHFGLYCFDLYEQIYIEAWDNHPELMPDLRDKYLREDFLKQIPRLILEYNIHGVDIDPRAIQIAGLSLWLRVHKSYNELGLLPVDRPNITKSNLVVAEPMPGDVEILSDFTRSLPGPIGKLVRVIWEKMQLVGETGMLLKIEEELKKEIEIAKEEYKKYKNTSAQTTIFDAPKDSKAAEMAAIYGKDQKLTKDFFDTAEEEVLKALKNFAENAQGENAFQKLLFAEDTARGFAFIELCRKRYDVIVMNPPFGLSTSGTIDYIDTNYKFNKTDLSALFLERMGDLVTIKGNIGEICTRMLMFLSSFKSTREDLLLGDKTLKYLADFGFGVLDAMVETCAFIVEHRILTLTDSITFFAVTESKNKEQVLIEHLNKPILISPNSLKVIPGFPFSYWANDIIRKPFNECDSFDQKDYSIKQGLATGDDFRFVRLFWETDYLKKSWAPFSKGGDYARFWGDIILLVNCDNNFSQIWNRLNQKGEIVSNIKYLANTIENNFFELGITWSRRTSSGFSARILPKGSAFSDKGPTIKIENMDHLLSLLAYLNSSLVRYYLRLMNSKSWEVGSIKKIPFPEFANDKFLKDRSEKIIQIILRHKINDYLSPIFHSPIFLDLINQAEFNFEKFKIEHNKAIDESNGLIEGLEREIDNYIFEQFKISERDSQSIKNHLIKDPDENTSYSYILKLNIQEELAILVSYLIHTHAFGISRPKFWDDSMMDYFLVDPFKDELQLEKKESLETSEIINSIKQIDGFNFGRLEEIIFKVYSIEIDEYILKQKYFFNDYLKLHTKYKRIAPILIPLTLIDNNCFWLSSKNLSENTLFNIINEKIDPRIKELNKEIELLAINGSGKDYIDQKKLLVELNSFKEELLRVAQLPYKPNQDDGVLITAAPLHNLFTHAKWRKSTEACWKKLEKGEYDWAHLAYSIWPDRVAQKCKIDLSMAIAHGLESICEVKPKETKKREKKGVKIDKQGKLI